MMKTVAIDLRAVEAIDQLASYILWQRLAGLRKVMFRISCSALSHQMETLLNIVDRE